MAPGCEPVLLLSPLAWLPLLLRRQLPVYQLEPLLLPLLLELPPLELPPLELPPLE